MQVRRARVVIGSAGAALLLAAPTPALACSCAPPQTPAQLLSGSTMVFSGVVTSGPGLLSGCSGSGVTRVEVVEGFKGAENGATVHLETSTMTGGGCGLTLPRGTRLLFFTSGHLNLCTPTLEPGGTLWFQQGGQLPESEVLAWLRSGATAPAPAPSE